MSIFGGVLADEGGDVDGEEGEHDDASDRQDAAEDFAGDGDGVDVAAEGGGVHAGPPECEAEVGDFGVCSALAVVEKQAAKIDEGCEGDDVGREEGGQFVLRESADHNGHGHHSTGKRNEAHKEEGFAAETDVEDIDEVEIGDGQEEVEEMGAQIVPFVGRECEFEEEVGHEDDADPELEGHVAVVFKEVDSLEGVDRYEHDEQHRQDYDDPPENVHQIFMQFACSLVACHNIIYNNVRTVMCVYVKITPMPVAWLIGMRY